MLIGPLVVSLKITLGTISAGLLDRFGGGWHPWMRGFPGLGSLYRGAIVALSLWLITGEYWSILGLGSGFLAEKWFWSHKGPFEGAVRGGLAGLVSSLPILYWDWSGLVLVPLFAAAFAISKNLPNPKWRGLPWGPSWDGAWNELWRGMIIGFGASLYALF